MEFNGLQTRKGAACDFCANKVAMTANGSHSGDVYTVPTISAGRVKRDT